MSLAIGAWVRVDVRSMETFVVCLHVFMMLSIYCLVLFLDNVKTERGRSFGQAGPAVHLDDTSVKKNKKKQVYMFC